MININNPDKHLEDEGVWVPFKGSQFLLASTGNFRFQKMWARLQLPYRKKIDRGTLDPETALDILAKSLAKTVLLDWKDVTGGDNESIPYTIENGELALKNNSDLREFIQDYSSDIENYREDDKEELGKS